MPQFRRRTIIAGTAVQTVRAKELKPGAILIEGLVLDVHYDLKNDLVVAETMYRYVYPHDDGTFQVLAYLDDQALEAVKDALFTKSAAQRASDAGEV